MGNYYLYRIAVFLTRRLPLSIAYAVAVFLSNCQYALSKTDRDAVRDNLKAILKTEKVSETQVRAVFNYFGKYLVDFFTMTQRVNKAFVKDSIEVHGIEYLNEVLQYGKGGIIVTAHIGNWEMGGAALSTLGYPLSAIALAHKDPRVNTFFNRQREFFGTAVIQTNLALRRCVEHLKRKRLIAIVGDRDFGRHGLTMNFLGHKAIIPNGAAMFSLKCGSPIIPAVFLRAKNNKFIIKMEKPIFPPTIEDGKITDKAVEELINQYLPFIEEQIRLNPTQWLVFRRFKVV